MKARYTNVPVQYDVRRSQQKHYAKQRNQPETNNTKKHQTNQTKPKNRPRQQNKSKPRKRGSHKHQPGQRTTRRADKTKQNKGAGGRRQAGPANKERADVREGSRGRRENAAQAKKAGACSFSGVLRVFWITRGRIPQCRSEGLVMKRSEDRSQSATTRHAKGMTTGPLQIQPDIRREGPAEH